MARQRKGMSEREYAERIGRSRVSVQDMKRKNRIVLHPDGSIDPDASDARRAAMERAAATALEASPRLAKLREAIEEQKLRGHVLRNDREAGALIDRRKAEAKVFALARQERDAWQTWPSRVAAQIAAEVGADRAAMQRALDREVRRHLEEIADTAEDMLRET